MYIAGRGAEIREEANENRKRGMVLPLHPVSVIFDEIRYSVDMPAVWKYLYKMSHIMEPFSIFFMFKDQVEINSELVFLRR